MFVLTLTRKARFSGGQNFEREIVICWKLRLLFVRTGWLRLMLTYVPTHTEPTTGIPRFTWSARAWNDPAVATMIARASGIPKMVLTIGLTDITISTSRRNTSGQSTKRGNTVRADRCAQWHWFWWRRGFLVSLPGLLLTRHPGACRMRAVGVDALLGESICGPPR
jgi:hypothetical protein